jgi:hypothetical protein
MLQSLQEASKSIENGRFLVIAGDEGLLSKLPKGNWIGGTIPYFMAEDGCKITKDQVFVNDLTDVCLDSSIKLYDLKDMPNINSDAPDHGFSILIIPAWSQVHQAYAQDAPNYQGAFMKPVLGWISGINLDDVGKVSPKVYDGKSGICSDKDAAVMHCTIDGKKDAVINILNVFNPGDGDTIAFEEESFTISNCLVNGERWSAADYIREKKINTKLPLVADYCGAKINVSFQSIDEKSDAVNLYAPVFKDVEYRVAAPLDNYIDYFHKALPKDASPVFSCNCILNFLYSELEGKVVDKMYGPITFGDIAYQLLNQTLVYLEVK